MRLLERRLRLLSGLTIAVYLIGHLSNHVAAIHSLQLAESWRAGLALVWHQPVAVALLYTAFVTHIGLACTALYRRRTLRMPRWEATQLVLGLLVVPLLAVHVAGTRGVYEWLAVSPSYARTTLAIWSSDAGALRQALLLLIVWGHLCCGLHFWLRSYRGYARWQPLLFALAVALPVLALTGLLRAGAEARAADAQTLAALGVALPLPMAELLEWVYRAERAILWTFLGVLGAVLLARGLRAWRDRRRNRLTLRLADGRRVASPPGRTVLESLRAAGVAHASVCGGRGRCTTCRIRVGAGAEALEPPGELERAALMRIGAPPNVRLACQTRPRADLDLTALLPPGASSRDARPPGGVSGQESVVTALFLDLRESTRLGERKLPYDVLFILNQFFADMAAALADSRGHYAQFAGDGLMALYGLSGDVEAGARDALAGAEQMLLRLERLNERLAAELDEPLRIGIGVHTGEAIVGTMGPPGAPNHTAIGDNINIAARLEAQTKVHRCALMVSAATLAAAAIEPGDLPAAELTVRGREATLSAYAVPDRTALRVLRGCMVSAPRLMQTPV